jgi:hypothetical protein
MLYRLCLPPRNYNLTLGDWGFDDALVMAITYGKDKYQDFVGISLE